MTPDAARHGSRRLERPPHPTGFEPEMRRAAGLVRQSAEDRACTAKHREDSRTAWISSPRRTPPDDPFTNWLWAVEDACFAAGREYEGKMRMYSRPHWRLWEFSQRMAWKFVPRSRLRQLLEPDYGEDEETGYRTLWVTRRPQWHQWDFVLRLLWFYARDSRLRHLLAPDKPPAP